MVAAGITGRRAVCALDWEGADGAVTRTAGAMRAALRDRPGAVVVVGCAPTALDEPTPRRTPSEYEPEGGTAESGGGKEPRGGRSDESIDEETGARSKRPGGTGDVSFGDGDEGPEGPAR